MGLKFDQVIGSAIRYPPSHPFSWLLNPMESLICLGDKRIEVIPGKEDFWGRVGTKIITSKRSLIEIAFKISLFVASIEGWFLPTPYRKIIWSLRFSTLFFAIAILGKIKSRTSFHHYLYKRTLLGMLETVAHQPLPELRLSQEEFEADDFRHGQNMKFPIMQLEVVSNNAASKNVIAITLYSPNLKQDGVLVLAPSSTGWKYQRGPHLLKNVVNDLTEEDIKKLKTFMKSGKSTDIHDKSWEIVDRGNLTFEPTPKQKKIWDHVSNQKNFLESLPLKEWLHMPTYDEVSHPVSKAVIKLPDQPRKLAVLIKIKCINSGEQQILIYDADRISENQVGLPTLDLVKCLLNNEKIMDSFEKSWAICL